MNNNVYISSIALSLLFSNSLYATNWEAEQQNQINKNKNDITRVSDNMLIQYANNIKRDIYISELYHENEQMQGAIVENFEYNMLLGVGLFNNYMEDVNTDRKLDANIALTNEQQKQIDDNTGYTDDIAVSVGRNYRQDAERDKLINDQGTKISSMEVDMKSMSENIDWILNDKKNREIEEEARKQESIYMNNGMDGLVQDEKLYNDLINGIDPCDELPFCTSYADEIRNENMHGPAAPSVHVGEIDGMRSLIDTNTELLEENKEIIISNQNGIVINVGEIRDNKDAIDELKKITHTNGPLIAIDSEQLAQIQKNTGVIEDLNDSDAWQNAHIDANETNIAKQKLRNDEKNEDQDALIKALYDLTKSAPTQRNMKSAYTTTNELNLQENGGLELVQDYTIEQNKIEQEEINDNVNETIETLTLNSTVNKETNDRQEIKIDETISRVSENKNQIDSAIEVTSSNKSKISENFEAQKGENTNIKNAIVINQHDINIATHDINIATQNREEISNRLTNISSDINRNSAENNNQHKVMSDRISENRTEAISGIAISMATEIDPPSKGKNFSLNLGLAEYEGISAIGITASGRLNDSVTLSFGYGTDTKNKHSATKIHTKFEW